VWLTIAVVQAKQERVVHDTQTLQQIAVGLELEGQAVQPALLQSAEVKESHLQNFERIHITTQVMECLVT
jgi:hypothetical protein